MTATRTLALLGLAFGAAGCRRDNTSDAASIAERTPRVAAAHSPPAVPVATRPTDPCGWIPADTVAAIVGKLAEPPRASEGGCLYTLTIPASVLAERAKMQRVRTAIKAPPIEYPPYAILLEVQTGVASGERGERLAGEKLASWLKDNDSTPALSDTITHRLSDGWDAHGMAIGGRLGTIAVWVSSDARDLDVPREKRMELASRVRDRIPDVPFPIDADYSAGASRDPCTLLTREEAESVLGKLVVAPYRSGNDGPLAYANGTSCAYYTTRHHVLIVTPRWANAKAALRATNGINGLVARVVNDTETAAADTIDGPWDEVAVTPDGRLEVRKGDQGLEIEYETSSTDKVGALRLARLALGRLSR